MACFGIFCGDPSETRKPQSFVSTETFISTDTLPEERRRAPIPWVWSKEFHENYQLGETLGQGSFAVVYEGTHLQPPYDTVAVKVIHRRNLSKKQIIDFKDEVQILADLQHHSIVRLYELYKDPHYFFAVMEKLNGGELFDRLCEIKTYNEKDARDAMRIIFEAMAYCHSRQVAHR